MSFESYTDCVLRAFRSHPKPAEVVKRKQEILQGVANFYNFVADKVLYVGFNPAIMTETASDIAVTAISQEAVDYLHDAGIQFTHIPLSDLGKFAKQFQLVINWPRES